MRYINGRVPEPTTPAQRFECKHCWEKFDEMGATFQHIKNEHGIDPFAPVNDRAQRQGAA